MEKVLNQAEQLAEAILESEEFIKMRLAEQAVMRDEEATGLISEFANCRKAVENLLTNNNIDHEKLAEANSKLMDAEQNMNKNEKIMSMRETNEVFTEMMKQVNKIIKFVVTGEKDEDEGCNGSCESCGGGCESCGSCH